MNTFSVATAPMEDHVLDILELEEPPPPVSLRKRNEKVASFMSQLYHDLEKGDERYGAYLPLHV